MNDTQRVPALEGFDETVWVRGIPYRLTYAATVNTFRASQEGRIVRRVGGGRSPVCGLGRLIAAVLADAATHGLKVTAPKGFPP